MTQVRWRGPAPGQPQRTPRLYAAIHLNLHLQPTVTNYCCRSGLGRGHRRPSRRADRTVAQGRPGSSERAASSAARPGDGIGNRALCKRTGVRVPLALACACRERSCSRKDRVIPREQPHVPARFAHVRGVADRRVASKAFQRSATAAAGTGRGWPGIPVPALGRLGRRTSASRWRSPAHGRVRAAHTVITATRPAISAEDAERLVAARTARQDALFTRSERPDIHVILDESVLHRQVGGPAVMAQQLAALAETATWPQVTLQVLPYTAGANARRPATSGSPARPCSPSPARTIASPQRNPPHRVPCCPGTPPTSRSWTPSPTSGGHSGPATSASPWTCPSPPRTPRASAPSSRSWSAAESSPRPNPACSPSHAHNPACGPATSTPNPTPTTKRTSPLETSSHRYLRRMYGYDGSIWDHHDGFIWDLAPIS